MNNILHRKDRLVITTISLIDELGIQGISTREIAKREGVSEATLFRHYKNKNELLIAVLDFYVKFDEDIFMTAKLKGLTPNKAIQFIMSSTAEYYENYPAITAITQTMDVLQYEPDLKNKIQNMIFNRSNYITQLIEEAKRIGEIKPNVDSRELSDIIVGSFIEIILKWRITRDFSLKGRIMSAVNVLLDSFSL